MSNLLNILSRPGFSRDEAGSITIMNLFFVMVLAIFAGIAIDMASLIQARTKLQITADTAAHAALYTRDSSDAVTAKNTAISLAHQIMPTALFGDVLRTESISFGTWDRDAQIFTHDPASSSAVLVVTDRSRANANPVTSFLLQFIGFDEWDVVTPAVFETYRPTCMMEGFVAEVGIEIQAHNQFLAPFCLHSNGWMDFASDNTFENGTYVSIPNATNLLVDYTSNTGLLEAMQTGGARRLRILQRIESIYDGIQDPSSRYYRDYITNSTPIDIDPKDGMDATIWQEGRIHRYTCTKPNESVTFDSDLTLANGVLITNCVLKLAGLTLENGTIITLSDDVGSLNSPSGLTIGKKDNCSPGGGAQLLTMGGLSVSSKMSLHGGQIIAAGDVQFTSHADGSWGASIVSGGTIDASSHNVMRGCDGLGMEDNFNAEYFRLAI